ncbi:MAG: aldo/keto reductase [Pelagimonas sp.]|jgi:aryl-alcohol dehydrogenase-like predicted oxidoreductase|nr:aldo/keto reductase [Pelagimonas sp.]
MTQPITTLSGEPVGRFAFGTMQFGGRADPTASRDLYETCRKAGLRHFDTAYIYTDGASETLLGACVAPERDQVYVASKVGYVGGAGRETILTQFDISRARLGLDVIDLLYMHRWDNETALDETIETLATLQSQGKIRHIGLSNYAAWQVMKAQAVAAKHDTRIDVIQPMFSLVKRQAEVELLPMCASEGILPATYSPLGGGLLTGKYTCGETGRLTEDNRYAARYGQEQMHGTARALWDLSKEVGTDPATLAVAWAAHHPARPVPILSARASGQLHASLEAMRFPMDDALYAQLSALSPKPAPATDRSEED